MIARIFDTETTGKLDTNPDIIEVGWLLMSPQEDLLGDANDISLTIMDGHEQRYKPSKPSTFGGMAVHHILPEELEECPPSSEFAFPQTDYLIGHSIDFDWEVAGKPDVKLICTYGMAQHVWQDADSYGLTALLYKVMGPSRPLRDMIKDAHNAINDCYLTRMLLREILREKPDIKTWEQLYAFSEDSRIPLRMPITAARGELLTDVDDGLLQWCLDQQHWMPNDHPYLYEGLQREYRRRQGADDEPPADDFDDEVPF